MTTTTTTQPSYPTLFVNRLSSVCDAIGKAQVMNGLFRSLMTDHFSVATWLEEPILRKLVWREGTDTEILIENHFSWRPELANARPAIIIRRNAWASTPQGIGGDLRQGQPVDTEGNYHYLVRWVGSHTLFCIAPTGAMAELLGTEVKRELGGFGPLIRETMSLLRFRVTQYGEVSRLEEAQENLVVPVTVGYSFEEKTILAAQAPRAKIRLSMLCNPE
jgi:hypothetical protein